jgi:alpha-glucoside transport system substrate-binding protein
MAAAVVGLAGALVLAGCSSSKSPSSGGSGASGNTGPKQTVTILGTNTGTEATELQDTWNAWAAQNNITIQYTGDQNFPTDIVTKIQGNSTPDIAFFPQPGLLSAAIATGKVQPLDSAAQTNVKNNFSQDWQNYVTSNGTLYGTPLDGNVKGYIWYSPTEFQKLGLATPDPKTYADMLTLTQQIQAKIGKQPWCAGFSSGTASGWPGADWTSEVVLGSAGPTTYDSWVKGTTKFTDPTIANAFTQSGEILLNPKYVNAGFGNVSSINSTAFGDVAAKVANGSCLFTNQANFLEANFATVKTASGGKPTVGPNGDIWAFMMPSSTAGQNAVMGAGDFAAAFSKTAATQKVMEYLSSAQWANTLITEPGATFITANKGASATSEQDPLLQNAMQILQSPNTTFRFSADDAMPNVVETAYWKGIVDWINGKPQATVLSNIQRAWASASGN